MVGLVHVRHEVRATTAARRGIGFLALQDLLEQVLGQFDHETDPPVRGRPLR